MNFYLTNLRFSFIFTALFIFGYSEDVLKSRPYRQPLENFPAFAVPGQEKAMTALNALHRLHYPPLWLDYPHRDPAAGLCTLWDEWLTGPCLWADTSGLLVCDHQVTISDRLKNSFLNKIIDAEGYVATHQHEGIGHLLGWPFPYWVRSQGVIGAHFSQKGTVSAVLPRGAPLTTEVKDWLITNGQSGALTPDGWLIKFTAPQATLTPPLPLGPIDPRRSPFIQIRWASQDFDGAGAFLEWEIAGQPGFRPEQRMSIPAAAAHDGAMSYHMIPLYQNPLWQGAITAVRINFGNQRPTGAVTLQAIFSHYDTRHNINNFDFIRGAIDTFLWTGDVAFLRTSMPRLRQALRFAQTEFKTLENNCVLTPWVGHEGTSGLQLDAVGAKTILNGTGIGNNYWDLLPFGYRDSYATIRYYDTLLRLASLEREIKNHPAWDIPLDKNAFDPAALENHAAQVKAHGNQLFWSDVTGRFVAGPDRNGQRHDYGFTFLNTDAIHYGFATDEHARSIMAWLDGKRLIPTDTSQGADIYHFRFGPRSTTKRNIEYYFWGWSNPEKISFGNQVQDGGAVFGWSYMDLSARLKVNGPDDAWARLKAIAEWFAEVEAAGGYQAYYKKQGTVLQGSGAAGGLGLDQEFFESLLVPQILLRGFLGLSPTADGFNLAPKLPSAFPALSIGPIRLKNITLKITVTRQEIVIEHLSGKATQLFIISAPGYSAVSPIDWDKTPVVRLKKI